MGVAARISDIFFYKESGKRIFYKESNLTKKKILVGGRGGGGARVSDFFSRRIQV